MKTLLFAATAAASDALESVSEVDPALTEGILKEPANMLYIDIGVFCAFVLLVIFVAIFMGRRRSKSAKESESYFLAGRGLGWSLIGFSLIAANISTEQFVGMSGNAADYIGLAIASYEWMAAVTLVFVAFFFLPMFLRTGIYTIPEFLEKRYNRLSRTLMSLLMVVTLITVSFAAIAFAGAKVFVVLFKAVEVNLGPVPINILTLSIAIGFIAMLYVMCGGLKACAWADLLQGSALIVGGGVILYFALIALGNAEPTTLATTAGPVQGELAEKIQDQNGWDRFLELNSDKLRMNLPRTDPKVPFTALFLGLWIPNFYYWGLNQYVVQRTLGSQSLSQGQKGIIFAAFMKLIIPFIIVFPGIIAFNLYHENLKTEAKEESRNGKRMTEFETLKGNPAGSLKIFDFNKDYAKLEVQKAQEIVNYNAAVLKAEGINVAWNEGATPFEQQTAIMSKVKEENSIRNEQGWKSWVSQITGAPSQKQGEEAADPAGENPTKENSAEGTSEENPATSPTAESTAPATTGKSFDVQKQIIGYDYDSAFPQLVTRLIPPGFRGFVLAAILGALISSLAAVLNAASTIITFDIYKEYFSPKASEKSLVFVGRICVVVFCVCGCTIAQFLDNPKLDGIFTYIQMFQGFISPGILAAFLFGFFARYAPSCCGPTALIGSPIIYGSLMRLAPGIPFLDSMAITFVIIIAMLGFLTAFFPRKEPFIPSGETTIDLRASRSAKIGGVIVVILTIGLYIYFWQYDWTAFGNFFSNLFFKFLS